MKTAVMELANCLLSIYRGTEANAYGDETDVGTAGPPLYQHVPAAVVERSRTVFDAATQRPQMIRSLACVVAGWTDITTADTVLNETTGSFYMVEGVTLQPTGPSGISPDKILTLRERSGVSVTSD